MKLLKYLLIFVVLAILIFVIGVMFAVPSELKVERTHTMSENAAQSYAAVLDLENWGEWDAWSQIDPEMTETLEGTPGTVGFKRAWKSDHEYVGNGSLTIESFEADKRVYFVLDFEENGQGKSYYTFAENEDGTTDVTAVFTSTATGFGDKVFFLFADKMIGGNLAQSLVSLDAYMDTNDDASGSNAGDSPAEPISLSFMEFPGATLLAVRTEVSFAELFGTFESSYTKIYEHLGAAGVEPAGSPGAVWHKYDMENQSADVSICVPVGAGVTGTDDLTLITIDAGPVLANEYLGEYDGMPARYEQIMKYIAKNNITITGDSWEVYEVGPAAEGKTPADYVTNIYFPISEIPADAPTGDAAE